MTVRRWLAVILLVTVLGRVAFILLFDHTLSLQTSGYDAYAVNLIEGRGYTRFDDRGGDSDLPPLYPFFLVGVYKTLGRDPIAVAVVQMGLDALTVLLLFWIGRRVAGEAVGLLAAAFYGAYPYLLYQNLTLNDTGLFIFLLTAGIAAAYKARDTRDPRWAAALGVAFGLGALTKTLIALVWPLLALWWWRALGLRRAIALSAASGIALLLVIAPWAVRNTRLRGGLSIPWLGRAVGQLHRARAGGSERNGGGSLAPRAGAGLPGRAPRRVAAPVLDEAVGAVESGDHALRPAA